MGNNSIKFILHDILPIHSYIAELDVSKAKCLRHLHQSGSNFQSKLFIEYRNRDCKIWVSCIQQRFDNIS